jgi:archaemetzincin
VLPGDDLALDPNYPPQSVRAWLRGKDRNKVTSERKTVYVVAPLDVDARVEFVRSWGRPRTVGGDGEVDVSPPDVRDVVQYLQAFYHGLPVQLLPSSGLKFAAWEDELDAPEDARLRPSPGRAAKAKAKEKGRAKASPQHKRPKPKSAFPIPPFIALNTPSESIRIRTRPTAPRGTSCHAPLFPAQLNLCDLLDAAIALLPADAHALLLLVSQDLFEDDDDDFVCGRAYGASRVAVVSCARYAPALDAAQGLDRAHAWPTSHCTACVADLCAASEAPATRHAAVARPGGQEGELADPHTTDRVSPMQAAISAHLSVPPLSGPLPPSPAALTGLWLGRVCKTAAHELGHCFGIDHCVYYACIMQGSASLAEDARQPPYLCRVEEAKLGRAVAEAVGEKGNLDGWMGTWARERTGGLRAFCGEMGEGEAHLWRAYGAWLEATELEVEG